MTANSIAYKVSNETERHNRVMEALEGRKRQIEDANREIEERKSRWNAEIGFRTVAETEQHNRNVEKETQWNNAALRYLQFLGWQENQRNNMEMESIKKDENAVNWYNAETRKREEEEKERSNRENERLTERGQDLNRQNVLTQADASKYVANVNASAAKYVANVNSATQKYVTDARISEDKRQFDLMLPETQRRNDIEEWKTELAAGDQQIRYDTAYLNTPHSRADVWNGFWGAAGSFARGLAPFIP